MNASSPYSSARLTAAAATTGPFTQPSPPSLPRSISFSTPQSHSRTRSVFDQQQQDSPLSLRRQRALFPAETPPPPPPPPPLPHTAPPPPSSSSRARKLEQDVHVLQFQNESFALDFEKSRAQQEKQRVELDGLKERLRKQKNEAELTRREEAERKRVLVAEMEEMKREMSALQAAKRLVEQELERMMQTQQEAGEEAERERERAQTKIDVAVRRAVEREEARWRTEYADRIKQQELELEDARAKLAQCERSKAQASADAENSKRLVQTLRLEVLNEKTQLTAQAEERVAQREAEMEALKKRVAAVELAKKRADSQCEELREANRLLEAEVQRERGQAQQAEAGRKALEKEREERRTSYETWEREETKRRTKVEEELKECRGKLLALETHALPQLEHQLEETRREMAELAAQAEEDRELNARKTELASKRAVERARQEWEEQYSARLLASAEELDEVKQALRAAEQALGKQSKECDELRRGWDQARTAAEREAQTAHFALESKAAEVDLCKRQHAQELDAMNKRLTASETARRKQEKDLEELKRTGNLLEEEMQLERTRVQSKIDLAVLKATERVKHEQRLGVETLQRQWEQERKQLQRELEEYRMSDLRLKQSVEELTLQLDAMRAELERQHSRGAEAIQAYEFELQQLGNERRHLEQAVQALEQDLGARWEGENALVRQVEEAREQIFALRAELQQCVQREDALLQEMDARERKASHDFLNAIEGGGQQASRAGGRTSRYLPPSSAFQPVLLPPPAPAPPSLQLQPRIYSPRLSAYSRRPSSSSSMTPSSSSTPLSRRLANARRLLDD